MKSTAIPQRARDEPEIASSRAASRRNPSSPTVPLARWLDMTAPVDKVLLTTVAKKTLVRPGETIKWGFWPTRTVELHADRLVWYQSGWDGERSGEDALLLNEDSTVELHSTRELRILSSGNVLHLHLATAGERQEWTEVVRRAVTALKPKPSSTDTSSHGMDKTAWLLLGVFLVGIHFGILVPLHALYTHNFGWFSVLCIALLFFLGFVAYAILEAALTIIVFMMELLICVITLGLVRPKAHVEGVRLWRWMSW